MPHGIWCSVLLIWVSSAQAAGQQQCVHPQTPWGCVGTVEIRSDRDGKSERRRMVVFSNGEMLGAHERGVLQTSAGARG